MRKVHDIPGLTRSSTLRLIPGGGDEIESSHTLPVTPDAPRAARDALDGWSSALLGSERAADARLVTSELVTNAVRHAGLSSGDTIHLSFRLEPPSLSVRVQQSTSAAGARLVEGNDRIEGGFGLALVAGLTTRWGVEAGPPGCVWFEMDGRSGPHADLAGEHAPRSTRRPEVGQGPRHAGAGAATIGFGERSAIPTPACARLLP